MNRKDNIKDMSTKIKDPELKPDSVDIVMMTTTAVPTQMQTVGLMIMGLGTDDQVYAYAPADCSWRLQR